MAVGVVGDHLVHGADLGRGELSRHGLGAAAAVVEEAVGLELTPGVVEWRKGRGCGGRRPEVRQSPWCQDVQGIGQGNVTNWEISQAVAKYKDKITFYVGGAPKTAAELGL